MVGARGQRRGGKRRPVADAVDSASNTSHDTAENRLVAINGLVPLKDRRMLQFLSRRTRVPQSEYLREALKDLLAKYRDSFEGSPFEDDEPL